MLASCSVFQEAELAGVAPSCLGMWRKIQGRVGDSWWTTPETNSESDTTHGTPSSYKQPWQSNDIIKSNTTVCGGTQMRGEARGATGGHPRSISIPRSGDHGADAQVQRSMMVHAAALGASLNESNVAHRARQRVQQTVARRLLQNDPHGVNHARQPGQQGEQQVQEKIGVQRVVMDEYLSFGGARG